MRDNMAREREKRLDGPALVMAKLASTAFEAHPYRNPGIGWPGDLNGLRRGDARAFLDRYYVPGNVTIAIVGDVNPADARRLATQYFGSWAAKPLPGPVRTQEPVQLGPKRAALEIHTPLGKPNPAMMAVIGYKRPSEFDGDDAALDILQLVLGQGHTGILQREFVTQRHIAQNVQVRATFPAGKYPNLFLFAIVAAPGHTVEESEKALEELLNRLKQQPIEQPVIDRASAQGRMLILNGMTTNSGLAALLAVHQANYGDWRKLFTIGDRMSKVAGDDVQRVLVRYFIPTNRTTVYTTLPGMQEAAAAVPAGGKQ
jgi:predicted Zn-dependent peptidase